MNMYVVIGLVIVLGALSVVNDARQRPVETSSCI